MRWGVFEPLILAKGGPRGYPLVLSNLAPQPPPEDPQYEKALVYDSVLQTPARQRAGVEVKLVEHSAYIPDVPGSNLLFCYFLGLVGNRMALYSEVLSSRPTSDAFVFLTSDCFWHGPAHDMDGWTV